VGLAASGGYFNLKKNKSFLLFFVAAAQQFLLLDFCLVLVFFHIFFLTLDFEDLPLGCFFFFFFFTFQFPTSRYIIFLDLNLNCSCKLIFHDIVFNFLSYILFLSF
jgi:hypothetical protein